VSHIAAFFDLDRTLLDVNSGLMWADYERRAGNLSRWSVARVLFWNTMYHLSLIDMEAAFARAVTRYRGESHSEIDRRTRDWFEREVRQHLRSEAAAAIADHRARGHKLVLLTSSTSFAAAVASEAFGLDYWLANEFPLDPEGCLTGEFRRPLCYGPGKVTRAEAFADEQGVDIDRSYYYADSLSDRDMLERVGEPRVVSPDPRLRLVARQRGWPILRWNAAPHTVR
jgi:HAD superfamily hydrolase (TIGR01490 family)